MYQEYKDKSIWYGVAAGAGIEILSTKITYWVNYITKKLWHDEQKKSTSFIAPSYDGKNLTICYFKTF